MGSFQELGEAYENLGLPDEQFGATDSVVVLLCSYELGCLLREESDIERKFSGFMTTALALAHEIWGAFDKRFVLDNGMDRQKFIFQEISLRLSKISSNVECFFLFIKCMHIISAVAKQQSE